MSVDDRIEQSNRNPRADTDPPVVEKVAVEHRDVRSAVASLREAMVEPRAERSGFGDRVERMASMLRDHFALEEDSGMFVDITAEHPELGHRVQALLEQHHTMRTAFADIVRRLRAGEDIDAALRAVLDLLTTHERTESKLIQDAYLTDLGRGG